MWSVVYFLIFLIPGFFAVLIYNLLCCCKMDFSKTIISAFIFDLLIFGINITGLYHVKAIRCFNCLECHLNCLSFCSKYILLSLVVGTVLAIIACLLSHLHSCCKKHFHHDCNNGNKN